MPRPNAKRPPRAAARASSAAAELRGRQPGCPVLPAQLPSRPAQVAGPPSTCVLRRSSGASQPQPLGLGNRPPTSTPGAGQPPPASPVSCSLSSTQAPRQERPAAASTAGTSRLDPASGILSAMSS